MFTLRVMFIHPLLLQHVFSKIAVLSVPRFRLIEAIYHISTHRALSRLVSPFFVFTFGDRYPPPAEPSVVTNISDSKM